MNLNVQRLSGSLHLFQGPKCYPTIARISEIGNARDFGHSGEGFWLQSPGVEVVNNVVAGAGGAAYAYYMRGLREFNNRETQFVSANLDDPSIAGGSETIGLTLTPIDDFIGNVGYASGNAIDAFYVNRDAPAGRLSRFQDSVFWNNAGGIDAPYGNELLFDSITLYRDSSGEAAYGFSHNTLTRDVRFDDVVIVGYQVGIWVTRRGVTEVNSGLLANDRNILVTSAHASDREYILGDDLTQLPPPLA